jgi:two-component system nitrate/nitrite response regulator NarL
MSEPVNVALLGRNSIVREGLRRILSDKNFSITQSVSQASNLEAPCGEELARPSLILVDNGVSECDVEILGSLQQRFPAARVVLLADEFDFGTMVKAFRHGAHGYIVKEISCERLIGALQLVAMGEKVLPSQLADELAVHIPDYEHQDTQKTVDGAKLSEREMEILRCLIMGCPNKVISRRLSISEATVKVHVKAVLRKLEVKNRTQAAIWAANKGVRAFEIEEPAAPAVFEPAFSSKVQTLQPSAMLAAV